MKLKSLLAAVPVAFLAVGCNNDVATIDQAEVKANEPQWMAVQAKAKTVVDVETYLAAADPADTHDLHGRSLDEFTKMQSQGHRRIIIMEMIHGTIPDTYTWGKEPSVQLKDVAFCVLVAWQVCVEHEALERAQCFGACGIGVGGRAAAGVGAIRQ